MTAKRFRVNELVKYNYSEIGEYIDENHTDRPLMNNEVCELLNELHEENKRLTDKLNQTALELVDVVISQGKAVEISEMSYREFLDYRAENGKPMELQL